MDKVSKTERVLRNQRFNGLVVLLESHGKLPLIALSKGTIRVCERRSSIFEKKISFPRIGEPFIEEFSKFYFAFFLGMLMRFSLCVFLISLKSKS